MNSNFGIGAHTRIRTGDLFLTNNALCPGTVSIPNANFSAISRVTNLNFAAAWRSHAGRSASTRLSAGMRALGRGIHFAGEHCSISFQGFMEGGAQEGIRAAHEIIIEV